MRVRLLCAAVAACSVLAAACSSPQPRREVQGRTVGLAVVERDDAGRLHVRRVDAPVREADGTAAALRDRPEVVAVSRDAKASAMVAGAAASGTDPHRGEQWGLTRLDAEGAWQVGRGDGQVVAVVDTGVDASHPDLAGVVLPGFDAVDGGDGRRDPNGHGTHVAGIVAGLVGNGVGGAGIAPGTRILPVRVLDAAGSGDHSAIAAGIIWAADHGADVINLSLGGPETTDVLHAAVRYAFGRGAVVVAAAGNDGAAGPASYPAAYPEVVAVGATTVADTRAVFSTTGDYVDLAAPGLGVLSTVPGGGYEWMSGTSMAAPFVAGGAALVRAWRPSLGPAEVASRLVAHAKDLGATGADPEFGAGLPDLRAARDASPSPDGPRLPSLPAPTLPSPGLPAPTLPSLPAPTLPSPRLPVPAWPADPPAVVPPGFAAPDLPAPVAGPDDRRAPTAMTATVTPAGTVTVASTATIRARLLGPAGPVDAARLELRAGGADGPVIDTAVTGRDGSVGWTRAFYAGARLDIVWAGDGTRRPAVASVRVDVSRAVNAAARLVAGRARATIRLRPADSATVSVERFGADGWATVATAVASPGSPLHLSWPASAAAGLLRVRVGAGNGYAETVGEPFTLQRTARR